MAGPSKLTGESGGQTVNTTSPGVEPMDLRLVLEHYLDGAALIVDGRIRFANRRLRGLAGYTIEETLGMTVADLLVAEDRSAAKVRISELQHGGPEYPTTYRLRRKDGSTTPVEVRSSAIEYDDGKALLSVVRDVSDRVGAEERLRAGEQRYHRLYDDNPTMYFTVDESNTVQSVNRFGAEQLGYEPWELEGRSVLKVFLDEDHDTVRQQLNKCLEDEDGIDTWELRKIRKDGSILWVHERARTVRDTDGNPLVLIVCEDITERRRAAEALREREGHLSVLSELMSDCCWVRSTQPDGSTVREWLGGSFERLTGYTSEEFERFGRSNLVHPDDLPLALERVTGPPGDSQHDFRIVTGGGDVRWLRERMRVVKREDGVTQVYGATWDVTQEKDAEEALRASREQLNQSQRLESLGKLAGGVAHDFNNLLMVIMGYGDLLVTRADQSDSSRQHAVAICKAAERAAALTGQLLAFSRKQTLQPRVVKLDALISDMGTMLGRLVPDDVELRLRLDQTAAAIRIDPSQLEQVVMNLIVNACDAISGGGRIEIETSRIALDEESAGLHPAAQPGYYVLLEVRDDGCGMNEEVRKHIFEPFFTTKGRSEGTGLGLSAVYGIVKQSGGYVEVSSESGEGTAIRIYFPITGESVSPSIASSREEARLGAETVLLVEDEPMVREMVRDALTKLGYTILEAPGPNEALKLCREHQGPIHLTITDVVMPAMDGKRLAERIVAERADIKVLFMSGYSADSLGKRGVLDPNVAFLQKPVSLVELGRSVRELLDEP